MAVLNTDVAKVELKVTRSSSTQATAASEQTTATMWGGTPITNVASFNPAAWEASLAANPAVYEVVTQPMWELLLDHELRAGKFVVATPLANLVSDGAEVGRGSLV